MDIIRSFAYAFRGISYVLRYERNARIHLVIALCVFAAGLGLGLTGTELAAIFFAIIMVFLAEIANTALEKTLDLIDASHNHKVKIIKDMAAGAVLIASFGAAIIGLVVFLPYVLEFLWQAE